MRGLVTALAAALVAGAVAAAPRATVSEDGSSVLVTGLPDAPGRLSVRVDGQLAGMAGTASRADGVGRFDAAFPLRPGLAYEAVWTPDCAGGGAAGGCAPIRVGFRADVPETAELPDLRVAVEPAAARLPANTLRLYLQFSVPMRRGQLARHVSLLGEDGTPVESPFLNLGIELWNAEQTRATLYLDPGRLKRGVGPNLEAGAPLEPGKRYAIRVDPGIRDATGRPMGASALHVFETGPANRQPVDPGRWRASEPPRGGSDPLEVAFDRVMDSAQVLRRLAVVGADGAAIPGTSALTASGNWRFTPSEAWPEGEVYLRVPSRLEDAAGNTPRHAFDVAGKVPEDGPPILLPLR